MTNQEAIKSLQDTLNDYLAEKCFENKDDVSRVCEPFDHAIKALEREEGCKNQVAQSFLCSACGCYCEYNDEYPVEYNYCPNCGRKVEK